MQGDGHFLGPTVPEFRRGCVSALHTLVSGV